MKKKVALFLAVIFSLGAFTLTACTDKEKPRELDSVEQCVIGLWFDNSDGATYNFYSDGTWIKTWEDGTRSTKHEFRHIMGGKIEDGEIYAIIETDLAGQWAICEKHPDRLYRMSGGDIDFNHYCER